LAVTARCLDVTRLVSRLGRSVFTGVDRVELAYLRALLADPVPLFLLVRTSLGLILLDRSGAEKALSRFEGNSIWGPSGVIGLLQWKAHPTKRKAEADLRRWSIARCRPSRLPLMLAAHLPPGTSYINVGHSNLRADTLSAWDNIGPVNIMLHDMIPLDYPHYQRPGSVEKFEARAKNVARFADRVICNSGYTRGRVNHWFSTWGAAVDTIVAHLGVDNLGDDALVKTTNTLDMDRPYFITVGTIEPRKNHAVLLDVWDSFAGDPNAPQLVIAGPRGWANEDVFARLNNSPLRGTLIHEVPDASDAQLAALISKASGLLFPSFAEGFGLPPLEALALGTPVVCSDLPVLHEILGKSPIYANPTDMYLWKQSVLQLAGNNTATEAKKTDGNASMDMPTWEEHFNHVLKVM